MSTTSVTGDYGYVVIAAGVIAFQVLMTGFIHVGGARRKVFGKEFLDRVDGSGLLQEHFAATGKKELAKNGYPDMGSGRYSALLSYGDWLHFANSQRVHGNYVEGAASVLALLLLAGLRLPVPAAVGGLVYIIAREMYAWGYMRGGANGRALGATLMDIVLLYLFACVLYSGIQMIRDK